MTSPSWLIPWTARGRSGPVTDNLLWHHERLYVMDNHRLALWCWWQHLEESRRWTFVHVDRHYDALWLRFNPWKKNTTAAHHLSLEAFRNARTIDGTASFALYRWDASTSALWSLHADVIEEVVFATADEGDDPCIPDSTHLQPWSLPTHLAFLADPNLEDAPPCIVDVDIDYLSWQAPDGACGQVFSDAYIRDLGLSLKAGLDSGRFGVVTVALSPSTTGSWQLAEHLLSLLLEPFPEYAVFAAEAP